jgi:hypothetical protein
MNPATPHPGEHQLPIPVCVDLDGFFIRHAAA